MQFAWQSGAISIPRRGMSVPNLHDKAAGVVRCGSLLPACGPSTMCGSTTLREHLGRGQPHETAKSRRENSHGFLQEGELAADRRLGEIQ